MNELISVLQNTWKNGKYMEIRIQLDRPNKTFSAIF